MGKFVSFRLRDVFDMEGLKYGTLEGCVRVYISPVYVTILREQDGNNET